jgi:hypothetical protein
VPVIDGSILWAGWALAYRGLWLTTVGRAGDGAQLITESLARARVAGAVISSPFLIIFLAEALSKLGRPAEGLSRLHEAAQFIETTDERYYEAEVHRVKADVLRIAGEHAEVEQSYRKALERKPRRER